MQALFQPMTIREFVFRNRVVMPPMVTGLADEDGQVTEAMLQHYAARAHAGTGMIIVEATAVDPGGRCWSRGLNLFTDHHIAGLAWLARCIHAEGAIAAIQLVHGGPQALPELCGGRTVAPSTITPRPGSARPKTLTIEEILAIEERFASAAIRAKAAGFDAVEIHGAHGFLLDSFLMSSRNARTDAYGGPLVNRMRMLLETCRQVKQHIGSEMLLGCRVSIYNKNHELFTCDALQQLVEGVTSTGIEYFHLSTDGAFNEYSETGQPLCSLVKTMTDVPVIVAGGLGQPADAQRIIAQHAADFVAIGHGMLDDPAWTTHAREAMMTVAG